MTGLKFDFDTGDLLLGSDGTFVKANIDSQCAALIAVSQVCRLTKPEIGAQIGTRIVNRPVGVVQSILAEARRMVEQDGGADVKIALDENNNLLISATYDS